MISMQKLFEAKLNMPIAQGPMEQARQYVGERIHNLKKQFSSGRIKATSYQMQLKELIKQKNDRLSGTFVEK